MFGSSDQSADPVVAGTEEEDISTNQEAVPIPYIAGERKAAVRWLTNVYNQFNKEVPLPSSKGGDKKGGGGGTGTYDYYGSIVGAVCMGQVDKLTTIALDGKQVWRGNVTREGSSNPYIGTIKGYGTFRFYWGTETQTRAGNSLLRASVNKAGEEHPDYKGVAFIEFKDLLFGREKVSAPSVEVVVARNPVQNLISGDSAVLDDNQFDPNTAVDENQANPITAVAELLTNTRYGLGMATNLFNAESFQDTADAVLAQKDLAYCSPFLNAQTTLREVLANTSVLSDAFLTWDKVTAQIKAGYWPHGVYGNLENLTVISEEDLTETPDFDAMGWSGVNTGWDVTFADREKLFKESSEKYDDLSLLELTGEPSRENLARPWITRRNQALAHAVEWGKSVSRPALTGELVVRRRSAAGLTVGELFKMDIDVEPGGTQLVQVCRCLEKNYDQTGSVTVRLRAETNLLPVAYTPPSTENTDVSGFLEPSVFTHVRPVEMPPGFSGKEYGVALLAQREDGMTIGYNVLYDKDSDGSFTTLGTQRSFGVKASLVSGYSSDTKDVEGAGYTIADAPVVDLTYSNTSDLLQMPDDVGLVGARDNQFLLILLEIDAGGQIVNDSNGFANMEIMSVVSMTSVTEGTRTLEVLRGRFSTGRWTFSAGAEAWLVRRSSIQQYTHADFPSEAAASSPVYFKTEPFNIFVTRNIAGDLEADPPVEADPTTEYLFPSARYFAPKITINPAPPLGPYVNTDYIVSGTITDKDGDLSYWSLSYIDGAGHETVVAGGPLDATGEFNFSVPVRFPFTGHTTPDGYTIKVRAKDSTTFIDSYVEASREVSVTTAVSAIAAPTSISTTTAFNMIWVNWTNTTEADLDVVEVWMSATDDISTSMLVTTRGANFASLSVNDTATRYLWLRSKDMSGNLGEFSSSVSGTARVILSADDVGASPIISNSANIGTAVINSASIANVSADKLIAGTIGAHTLTMNGASSILKSSNFVEGTSGWQIKGDGNAQFMNMQLGGYVNDGGVIKSANFLAGVRGWQIDGNGNAEFSDINIRKFVPQPVLLRNGNVFGGGTLVESETINVFVPTGCTVRYTKNGSTPTPSSTAVTGGTITLNVSGTWVFVSFDNTTGWRSTPLTVPVTISRPMLVFKTLSGTSPILLRTCVNAPFMFYARGVTIPGDPSAYAWGTAVRVGQYYRASSVLDGYCAEFSIPSSSNNVPVAFFHASASNENDRIGPFYYRTCASTSSIHSMGTLYTNSTAIKYDDPGEWVAHPEVPTGGVVGDDYPY